MKEGDYPPSYEELNDGFVSNVPGVNPAYESNEGIMSPPTAPPYEPPTAESRPPVINLGVLSEDDVRDACAEYAVKHCCYGSKFCREADFTNIFNGYTFHYLLESYGEQRQTLDQTTPFTGQQIDGPENGPPPRPWDITVRSPPLFKDGQVKVEVPHTATVTTCHRCVGNCRVRCEDCSGMGGRMCLSCLGNGRSGSNRCSSCGGNGRQRCWDCSGTGQVKCPVCSGRGRLKHYKMLIVTWRNHADYFISDSMNLPRERVKEVSGREIFKEQHIQVYPMDQAPDESVNGASKALIGRHKVGFPNELIRMQRHSLRAVPVTKAIFHWKNKPGEFYVYGFQKKVYFENYPQKCCCCPCL